jgi:peroxiredoxin
MAGVAKLLDRQGSRDALRGFGVPNFAVPAGALLLPIAELATAVALVPPSSAQWGGVAAVILLLAFIAGISNAMIRGRAPDCHCFGQIHSEPAGRSTLVRNVALAAVAGFVVVEGPGPSVSAWVSDRTAAELGATATGIAALVLGVVALSLWRDKRSLTRSLDNARERLAAIPPGLPVGTLAPDFALTSTSGETVTLADLRSGGKPVGLVFVSPDCGPCSELFPEVTRWQRALAGGITLALISTGTAEENRKAVGDNGTNVLLQEEYEVTMAYRVASTPTTVVVNPDGRIASPPASGNAIESLIRLTLRRSEGQEPHRKAVRPQPVA